MFNHVHYGAPTVCYGDSTAVTDYDEAWFPSSEWTYYEAHIKFADAPNYDNGEIDVWYGDEHKMSVSGLTNRNSQHIGHISYISIMDYCNHPHDTELGQTYIDNLIISDERISK